MVADDATDQTGGGGGAPLLTLIGGRLRVAECGGPLVLSTTTQDCCCCPPEERYFRGFTDPDTWFKSAEYHDEDECYFSQYKPDGWIKITAVEPDDSGIPEGESYCGLFKVTDGSNWFTEQLPVGTYVRRGGGGIALGAIWNPPVGGGWQIESNTKIGFNAGPNDPCKNFGDKIYVKLSDEVQN